ncbi:sugar kinase domain protein [Mycobacterium xenopi 3993]|nr:sugar kinase domain protein [Mycobacterium xenopi 3993]
MLIGLTVPLGRSMGPADATPPRPPRPALPPKPRRSSPRRRPKHLRRVGNSEWNGWRCAPARRPGRRDRRRWWCRRHRGRG